MILLHIKLGLTPRRIHRIGGLTKDGSRVGNSNRYFRTTKDEYPTSHERQSNKEVYAFIYDIQIMYYDKFVIQDSPSVMIQLNN